MYENTSIESSRHAFTLLISDVKFLVCDEELRSRSLAGSYVCVGMSTFPSEFETILISEIPNALQRGSTIDRYIIFGKQCYELLMRV